MSFIDFCGQKAFQAEVIMCQSGRIIMAQVAKMTEKLDHSKESLQGLNISESLVPLRD
jgi:hypothetical protein